MARRATLRVGGRLAQMGGHFLGEADGRRAAQYAPRDAAAERRVGIPPAGAAAWVTCVGFFCGPERASAVCECRQKPFNANTRAWGRLCAQLFVFAELVHFPRERQLSS